MDKRIRKAYDIIRRRYADKILLEDLAHEVGLSPFHFHRLFKKQLNETPSQCLARIRMERAKHLMVIDPNLSISNIAEECGFTSLSSFSRSFSSTYGKSPTEYLKSFDQPRISRTSITDEDKLIINDPMIIYFPGCRIFYAYSSVYQKNLIDVYDSVKAFCYLEDIQTESDAKRYGVFTHIHQLFSKAYDDLNYYAGIEIKNTVIKKYAHRCFSIPEGRYASFTTTTSYFDLYPLLMEFKTNWLDIKQYKIKEPFAFEHISEKQTLYRHPNIERIIYIPII